MGGHGGLNILPQKRWHVYRDDNRLRVLRDEREFQEAVEAQRQQQQRLVMSDVVTRLKRRKHGVAVDSSGRQPLQGPEAGPSTFAQTALVSAEQPIGEVKRGELEKNTTPFGRARISEVDRPRLAQGTRSPVSAAGDQCEHPSNIISSAGSGTGKHPPASQSSNPSSGRFSDDTPVMVRPLDLNRGRIDPLGRKQDGHFNFFAAAESEEAKQHKARERYLLQAGHSTSRQSEFSGIAKELKNIWYQSEMPSNRIAREEKEDRVQSIKRVSVEAASEEARRRMLATQQRQAGGGIPPSSSTTPPKGGQHKTERLPSDSDGADSDVCIVKECFVGSRDLDGTVLSLEAKKAVSKSDSTSSSRKERKLLKRMKRKWMLEALDLQTKLQGCSKGD